MPSGLHCRIACVQRRQVLLEVRRRRRHVQGSGGDYVAIFHRRALSARKRAVRTRIGYGNVGSVDDYVLHKRCPPCVVHKGEIACSLAAEFYAREHVFNRAIRVCGFITERACGVSIGRTVQGDIIQSNIFNRRALNPTPEQAEAERIVVFDRAGKDVTLAVKGVAPSKTISHYLIN